ncbi:FAD binding domain-containing protein [Coniochaeta sp. 2T2.1]|nr:FAD binding domain-containing protein [Coniochaeta sp. 2T2.1]
MRFPSLASCALAVLHAAIASAGPSCPDSLCLGTRAHLTAHQIAAELGPLISTVAQIFGPTDARWENATERFQTYKAPRFTAVVEPATEADVATIVKYANRNSLPFLAVNRAHGHTSTLGKFNGLQINLAGLRNIIVAKDGKSALMQGGVYVDQVVSTLWDAGYVANTGSCACVGLMGPALGGGHGRLQGLYGLVSDGLIQLNVVLADGSTITVSDTQNKDLFWAMRGAGHNFGIVTSFVTKIWPKGSDWYYRNLVFTQDKLEPLFEAINKLGANGTQPKELGHFGEYTKIAAVSDPVIYWSFSYAGPQADAEAMLAPFTAIGPISFEDGTVPYSEIAVAQKTGMDDPICAPELDRITATAGLQVFNISTQRQVYELFRANIKAYPELIDSYVLMEQYAVEAVKAVDSASQSFPWRDDYLLLGIDISYPTNHSLDATAQKWVAATVNLWNAGQSKWRKPSAYVNYASGNEPMEQWYGYEAWRLAKLRALKKRYDPNGRFSYYNPITY